MCVLVCVSVHIYTCLRLAGHIGGRRGVNIDTFINKTIPFTTLRENIIHILNKNWMMHLLRTKRSC